MKHTARYLDSGFYVISDKAAGHLVRSLGQKLPKHGWQKFVMLEANGMKLNAWMQRTPTCMLKRQWHWAIFGMRPDGEGTPITLGKSFQFVSVVTLNSKAA